MTGVAAADQDTWSAGDYTRVARLVSPVAETVVSTGERMLGSLRGQRVLDVGCGTGTVARSAAARGAHVVGIDTSEAMLTLAAGESDASTPAVTWISADMHALPDDDAAFDAVLSSLAVIFARDPASLVAELGRVLRPGGVLAVSTWASMPDDPLSAPMTGLVPGQGDVPDPWSGKDALRRMLSRVCHPVAVAEHALRIWFADLDDAMAFVFRDSPAHLAVLAALPTEDYLRVQRRVEAALLAHQQDDRSIAYDRRFLVAAGRRR